MAAFRFKQFAVEQDGVAMKVGTDGVLLGAAMTIKPSDRRLWISERVLVLLR